jgi:hypothetical protein
LKLHVLNSQNLKKKTDFPPKNPPKSELLTETRLLREISAHSNTHSATAASHVASHHDLTAKNQINSNISRNFSRRAKILIESRQPNAKLASNEAKDFPHQFCCFDSETFLWKICFL